ncbi:MAG: 2-dehydropantoate 2-reductase [Aestuariivirga sp.]|uniref:2-dehydropantoate 2-reductase n=1 Tax=Aestuariivirga sp. TaxID=2650926 RepID=UPI0025C09265|nr:2-dehydropantoate 2-reductase [Aestuariivirga sp.]MCA3562302.1 2-dehydropantoate 2-reductase [Aestuariivirga sp.]
MTKICIFGAGAIGGYVGARLALKGEADVSLVARGAHLRAMQAQGLTLKQDGETYVVRPRVTSEPKQLGPQDFIILTLKAHSIAGVMDQMMPLIGKDTAILFAQNGIPWWYFHGVGGPYEGARLESVDPGGIIWDRIGPERALGTVVWQAAEIEAPGVIAHKYGDRMPLGEPTGDKTERTLVLSKLLTSAGIKSPVRPNLRNEIWLKLWGNLSFNPVSVLTLGTLQELATDPGTRRVIRTMMEEARAVAEKLGVSFAVDADERMDMAAKVGAHRTSMLQDVEAGRPAELDSLLGVVIELGRLVEIGTPSLQLVYDLCKFRSQPAGRGPVTERRG